MKRLIWFLFARLIGASLGSAIVGWVIVVVVTRFEGKVLMLGAVGALVLSGVLAVHASTLFLVLVPSVRNNNFLSCLSFFLLPVIKIVIWTTELLAHWPRHRGDFILYTSVSLVFLICLGLFFYQFRKIMYAARR